jgi:antitoxin component YwqK of YwqJK toxin-antitoxin module
MIRKITIFIALSAIPLIASGQSEINRTDSQGRKQGHWIKKYPSSEAVLYEGYFNDDRPTGEFRRYYEDRTLKSLMIYDQVRNEVAAKLYYPNGFIASEGKYVNQMKEGKWKFYSGRKNRMLICEEYYSRNLRNGLSLKFYPDSILAERLNYLNDAREGEWSCYYSSGSICLRSYYRNNMINGKFEVWYEDGKMQFSGQYKDDLRDGTWFIYNSDGTMKYKTEYKEGIPCDNRMDIEASDYLDMLEKNGKNITDPEKTGELQ